MCNFEEAWQAHLLRSQEEATPPPYSLADEERGRKILGEIHQQGRLFTSPPTLECTPTPEQSELESAHLGSSIGKE